jgi:hypothetical protein
MNRFLPIAVFLAATASASPIAIHPRTTDPDVTSGMARPHVAVASNGKTFIVAWEDRSVPASPNSGKIYYRTFTGSGSADQSTPTLAVSGAFAPAVVWNGAEWVIAASATFDAGGSVDLPTLRAARISEHGGAIGSETVVLSAQTPPALTTGIAANGAGLLIGNGNAALTARDLSQPRTFRFRVKPLAAAGGTFLTLDESNHVSIVTNTGIVLTDFALQTGGSVAATANGSEYGVVITAGGGVEAMTLATNGLVTSHQTLQTNANSAQPAVAFSDGSYLAAWALPNQLCTERFTPSSIGTAQCEARQSTPNAIALASGTSGALLAWSETVAETATGQVWTRLYPTGGVPASAQTVVSGSAGLQRFPRIERGSDRLRVAWTEPALASRLVSVTLDSSGDLRSAAVIAAPSATLLSNVRMRTAHNAAGTLTVWSQSNVVMAQLMRDDGSSAAPIVIGHGNEPEVATDGNQWLIVWLTNDTIPQIASTIVTSDLTVVAPEDSLLVPSDTKQALPAVASRGSDYLVVWTETSVVKAIAVSTSGNAGDKVLDLTASRGVIEDLQVAASGDKYLVVAQNETGDIAFPVTQPAQDIFVAGVAANQPWRVRNNDNGFALLEGSSPIRTRFIDRAGVDVIGGVLPIEVTDFDFVYDGPRLFLAYEQSDGYLSSNVFLDIFGPRVRPSGMR